MSDFSGIHLILHDIGHSYCNTVIRTKKLAIGEASIPEKTETKIGLFI